MSDAPLVYYSLDESDGTVALDSVQGLNGTYGGGPLLGNEGAFVNGLGTSADFDGSNDSLYVGNNSVLNTGSFVSVEAWVKPESSMVQYATVVNKTSNTNWTDGYGMSQYSSGKINFFVNQWKSYQVEGTLPADQWSHVVGTYDGSELKLYINGELVESLAYVGSINQLSSQLRVGHAIGNRYYWNGGIDDVAIYDYALSEQTIQEHYLISQNPFRQNSSLVNIEADAAVLAAANSVGTDASAILGTVSALESVTANGGLYWNNRGALTIGQATERVGIDANGAVVVEASSPVWIAEDIRGSAAVRILARDNNLDANPTLSGHQPDSLYLGLSPSGSTAPVTVQSDTAAVVLLAGDDVYVHPDASVEAAISIEIVGDFEQLTLLEVQ